VNYYQLYAEDMLPSHTVMLANIYCE